MYTSQERFTYPEDPWGGLLDLISPLQVGRLFRWRFVRAAEFPYFFLRNVSSTCFLDVPEVLAKKLLLVFGEEPERHPHHALRELHVQPVLAMFRPAGHVEIELTHGRAVAV